MYTVETAPKGYTGPVRLSEADKAKGREFHALWLETLRRQAEDSSDPETQENAQQLLAAFA